MLPFKSNKNALILKATMFSIIKKLACYLLFIQSKYSNNTLLKTLKNSYSKLAKCLTVNNAYLTLLEVNLYYCDLTNTINYLKFISSFSDCINTFKGQFDGLGQ